jgi:arylsulfatase A-like enzyme
MKAIYIDVDSLRPDFLGAYGYDAMTSPEITALASDGVRFDRAYAANSPCMASRASFLSGRYGVSNGIVTHGTGAQRMRLPRNWHGESPSHLDEAPIQVDGTVYEGNVQFDEVDNEVCSSGAKWSTLPELLFNNDIETAAISSFPRHPAPWFYHLWDYFRHPREPDGTDEGYHTVRAETVVNHALEYLDGKEQNDDFFLYVQLWDPHGPYMRTDDEVERFRGEVPEPAYPTGEQIKAHQEWDARMSAPRMGIEDRSDLLEMVANYCAEIQYTDEQLSRLLDHLHSEELYDESLIIFTADHGEEFGERGVYRDHGSTHEATQRVPLVIKPPASRAMSRAQTDELVTNVDMAPTVAEYFDVPIPGAWQGRSLVPLLEADAGEWRDHLIIEHGAHTVQRSIVTDEWKLTKTLHPSVWDEYEDEFQLYDLAADPHEQDNLAPEQPDLVDHLHKEMLAWVEAHREHGEDPLLRASRNGPPYYFVQKGRGSNYS